MNGSASIIGWCRSRFELDHGHAGHVNRPMEGLRGFAVFLVFLVHYATLIVPWIAADPDLLRLAGSIRGIGNAGVDLFFVLSGYLIYGSLISRPQPFLAFMRRRVRRIYPAFAVVFAVYVALSFAMPSEGRIPHAPLAAAVYLVENFLLLPGLFPIEPIISVAWSLSYEMFYYLAIPLLIAAFGLRVRPRRWRVALFLATAVAIVVAVTLFGGPFRLVMFIVGVLLFETKASSRWMAPTSSAFVALALALLSALLPVTGTTGFLLKIALLSIGCFVFFRTCFFGRPDTSRRVFSSTPLRWFGNMSYSYYLLHGLALKVGFLLLGRLVAPPAHDATSMFCVLVLPMFALSLVPTIALFLLVERPYSLVKPRSAVDSAT